MKKLVRLLAAISLITIGSARALFRGDLNQVDPDAKNMAQREATLAHNPPVDPVDHYHQLLIFNINKTITALEDLPAKQVAHEGQAASIQSAIAHLKQAYKKAMLANAEYHKKNIRRPYTNDQIDFHHARLMEELKKSEQHVYGLGYVTMKRRSDIIADILQAEQAAVSANRACHDQKSHN